MQVDNQTLITIIKKAIQSSITPDYVAWVIGIAGFLAGITAIIITLRIYNKQTQIQNEQKQFEKTLVNASRTRIRTLFKVREIWTPCSIRVMKC